MSHHSWNIEEVKHSNTYGMNTRRSHRDSRSLRRISFLMECTVRRVRIWTGSKVCLVWGLSLLWNCCGNMKWASEQTSTYFVAGTFAILFVVTPWTVFRTIADCQLKDALTSFVASVLISRACYLRICIIQTMIQYKYLQDDHMRLKNFDCGMI